MCQVLALLGTTRLTATAGATEELAEKVAGISATTAVLEAFLTILSTTER